MTRLPIGGTGVRAFQDRTENDDPQGQREVHAKGLQRSDGAVSGAKVLAAVARMTEIISECEALQGELMSIRVELGLTAGDPDEAGESACSRGRQRR